MALESNIGGMWRLLLRYTAWISLCLVSMVARAQSTTAIEPGAVLSRTTQLLKELSQSSPSTVPDAVLNRAQCVVLIPAGTRRLRPGTVSCRETSDQWNTPTAVTFEGRAGSRRSADILIFVVTDAAVKSLRSGSLRVASSTKPLAPVAPKRNEKEIDKYHATKGFEITCFGHVYHVAYHYVILTSGRIQKGRPERCEGAHAKNYNSYLGISVVGDFDSRDNPKGEKGPTQPNTKQMAALVRLSHQLVLRYHIPVSHVVRHSDIAATRCPGDRLPFGALLRDLKTPGLKSSRSR